MEQEKLNIIPNLKSQDKDNRKRLPSNISIPKIPSNTDDKKYITEAKKYVEIHFPNNYGNTDNFIYPVKHNTAKKWLDNFISHKFNQFGDYQDFIKQNNHFMFHSVLSSSINIGLIQPIEILDKILHLEKTIKTNSFEGYIRQLFWREYQKYCYLNFNFKSKNYFGNTKKLTSIWYTGKTGIKPVDDAIVSGFETGYLHHILRLMVMGNFMNLYGLALYKDTNGLWNFRAIVMSG